MKRIQHSLTQNTQEWHAFRADHDGASEAAPMLGISSYLTRSELLRQKATGIKPEVDAGTQARFDAGHATEAAARPLAEDVLADELYPTVFSYGRMSASLDGLTIDGVTNWQHKLWNANLAAAVARGELPDEYMAQIQQEMLVSGAEQTLFMVSDGTAENCQHMFVRPDPAWHKRIIAGWAQFQEDLANYQHVEVLPAAVAAPTMQLPALSIQVTGSIALVDNLKVFGERLESFIHGIDKAPQDDQGFADAEAAIKTLGTAETALEAAKASALAQTASIDDMVRTVKLYADQARTTRLMLEKMVKARKESIRVEIVQGGKDALSSHIAGLNKRLGRPYMPAIAADFAGAAKGKRTIASLRDACDTELARAKIEANAVADRIQINLATMKELSAGCEFLFADAFTIVHKAEDDFTTLVKMRIQEHKAAEEKRLEVERTRIRAEEAAKLAREQEENTKRLAEEARAKEKAAAQVADASTRTEISNGAVKAGSPAPAAPNSSAVRTDPQAGFSPAPTPVRAVAGTRPTDDQIIDAISLAFRVHESKAIEWLLDLDLNAAAERLSKEFA